MYAEAPWPILVAIFALAAAIVWWAGIRLSNATDVLAHRLGLGGAMGGMIFLAIATNLPEVAIAAAAAWRDDLGVAIGNILGGIAMQTVVLVLLDAFDREERNPLSFKAADLALVLEGVLVVAVLIVAIMASRLPAEIMFHRIAPGDVAIAGLWAIGLWLVGRAARGLPWRQNDEADGAQAAPKGHSRAKVAAPVSTTRAALVFAVSAVATLVCGVALEGSGSELAARVGLSGVLFGATVLALATSLPEISTGLAAVRLGDHKLAVSDIFGGNAFLPVLFLLATVVSGRSSLPQAHDTDLYLAGLGILLTCVYLYGLIFRSRAMFWNMGIDSIVVLVLYAVGVGGLFFIAP